MPQFTGPVQRMNINAEQGWACAWIGPSLNDAALVMVQPNPADSAGKSMLDSTVVDALSAAMSARREVVVSTPDNGSQILSLQVTA